MLRFLLTALLYFTISPQAYAVCTNPGGLEGEFIYNKAHKVLQYCDGEKWRGMGGGTQQSNITLTGNQGVIPFKGPTNNLATTPLFFWNSANNTLHVGNTNGQSAKLNVETSLAIYDTTTGNDGFSSIWMYSDSNLTTKTLRFHYGGNNLSDNQLRFGRYGAPPAFGYEANPIVFDLDAPNYTFYINGDGNVGINTSTATEKLQVNGNIKISPGNALYTDIFFTSIALNTATPPTTNGVTCTHGVNYPNNNYTDCTCPSGYIVHTAGGYANVNNDLYLRESRPHTDFATWRVGCKNIDGTPNHCQSMTITCIRIQPN